MAINLDRQFETRTIPGGILESVTSWVPMLVCRGWAMPRNCKMTHSNAMFKVNTAVARLKMDQFIGEIGLVRLLFVNASEC